MNTEQCKHESFKLFGFFANKNGIVQRYRCRSCGKNFSEQTGNPNRLYIPVYNKVLSLFNVGYSIRKIRRFTGVHLDTLTKIRRAIFRGNTNRPGRPILDSRRKKRKKYTLNNYRRLKWRDHVREYAGWFLAKSANPIFFDDLFYFVQKKYKRLKKTSFQYMLRVNCTGWFFGENGFWTYQPGMLWLGDFEDLKNGKSNIRLRARKHWFKKHNMTDEMISKAKTSRQVELRQIENNEFFRITAVTRQAFIMFNTASLLTQFSGNKSQQKP